ncbi:UNVERIFIED_CONTAM: hypothetical protein K2H54_062717 [Gekko kuhli]
MAEPAPTPTWNHRELDQNFSVCVHPYSFLKCIQRKYHNIILYFVLLVHVVVGNGLDPTIFYTDTGVFLWLKKLSASAEAPQDLASPHSRNKMVGSHLSDFFP